jgi:hypothetical protein
MDWKNFKIKYSRRGCQDESVLNLEYLKRDVSIGLLTVKVFLGEGVPE